MAVIRSIPDLLKFINYHFAPMNSLMTKQLGEQFLKEILTNSCEVILDHRESELITSKLPVQNTTDGLKYLIYCNSTLLDYVQQRKLFNDCKHFVDMPLRFDPKTTLTQWEELLKNQVMLTEGHIREFICEHFDEPGSDLEVVNPSDYTEENDAMFSAIQCDRYRTWAKELHKKWPKLCRKVSEHVSLNAHKYSLINLPNPFIIPGGRFREMYYWDSFFTIRGLLASKMYGTICGIIENMGYMIDQFGFVPNGNRIYYLNRSQPPMLTWCIYLYRQVNNDIAFLRKAMKWIEKEMTFFQEKRAVKVQNIELYRYCVETSGPRPESYREDVQTAGHLSDLNEKERLWGDIAAAAESGRDFSSRWFTFDGLIPGKMSSIRTSSIIPVDLNAIICGNWKLMAGLYEILEDNDKASQSLANYENMRKAIHQVFWNEKSGCWFDYDIASTTHVSRYMDTNFFPLFTGCLHDGFDVSSVVDYLTESGVLVFPGGLPTSLVASGEQWDFPNAWAPTTWIIIEGLRLNGQIALAKQLAEKWIRRNYLVWMKSGGIMYEKYDVASESDTDLSGGGGGGGEYETQEGFGWTNGVILDLLLTFPDLNHVPDSSSVVLRQTLVSC